MPIVPPFSDVCPLGSSPTEAEKAVGNFFRVVGGRITGPNLLVGMKNAVKSPKVMPVDVDNLPISSPSSLANRPLDDKAPQPLEDLDNNLDPDAFRAFLRDYLPNPKAPERLKAWIRELPCREPKLK